MQRMQRMQRLRRVRIRGVMGVMDTIGIATSVSIAACAPSQRSAATDSASHESARAEPAVRVGVDTVTGGPERVPVPPPSSGCGGAFVVVTVKASALANAQDMPATTVALRTLSSELLAPVRALVGATSISPAVRAFRVAIRNPATAPKVVAQLRASPRVESAETDGCEVMIPAH